MEDDQLKDIEEILDGVREEVRKLPEAEDRYMNEWLCEQVNELYSSGFVEIMKVMGYDI